MWARTNRAEESRRRDDAAARRGGPARQGPARSSTMLKASWDLSADCDFGQGVYAAGKGPDEFGGIEAILRNNYPRSGPWKDDNGIHPDKHYRLASRCFAIVVPKYFTPAWPLAEPPRTVFGPIRETIMRQGFQFDPDTHNIFIIKSFYHQKSF